jgi:hypothetical protein
MSSVEQWQYQEIKAPYDRHPSFPDSPRFIMFLMEKSYNILTPGTRLDNTVQVILVHHALSGLIMISFPKAMRLPITFFFS